MKIRLWLIIVIAGIDLVALAAFSGSVSAARSVLTDSSVPASSDTFLPPVLPDTTVPNAPLDIPEVLVNSGTVNDFMRVDTTIYWHSAGFCYTPPAKPNLPANPGDVPESVTRISTIYASPPRMIYYKDIRATNSCNQYVFSRVVADANYLYWVDATGLVKLSKNANPGNVPTVLSASFADQQPYQIAIDSQYIYLSRDAYSVCGIFGCFFNPSILFKIDKTTGTLTGLDCTITVLGNTCPYAVNMKVDPSSERYLYYIDTSSNLQRMDLSNPTSITQLSTQVHSYYPEGQLFTPCGQFICLSDNVFIGRGNTAAGQTHEIVRYNNSNSSSTTIYTSSWTDQVSINDLVSDGSEIFFYEVRADLVCGGCFQTYTAWLYRSGRANASTLANIYQYSLSVGGLNTSSNLDDDNVKVYWKEAGLIKRLSNQATALPKSSMHVVGMEVTQGVQTTGNTVPLIQGKRTFVRLYVKSDDSSRDVPKVTARLRATWTGGTGGGVGDWIDPSNVFAITVKRNPSRQNLDDAFLFEVPWDWVSGDNLQITAELNPGHNPEQSDNYVNNTLTSPTFHLNPSPRLEIRLFGYSYAMSNTVYAPAYSERFGDIDWIRRAYPVNETDGPLYLAGAGLHWAYSDVRDDALANLVRYPQVPCEDKDTTSSPDPKLPDCQNLRAAAYVQSQIAATRDDYKVVWGDTDNTSYYGLVPPGAEVRNGKVVSYFPRGEDSAKNAAGPAGNGYLGWYAGHEVGHSVGLGHPATASAGNDCGIKGSDSYPTNPNGHIGSNNDATNVEGFLDTPTYNYPRYNNANLAVGSKTMDVMAYCLPQWLSDQNYVRIYQNLTGVAPTRPVRSPQLSGNWLIVYGGIFSGTNTASIDVLQHKIGDATLLPRVPGNYSIRLRDINGSTLADYPFTPNNDGDSNLLLYGQVVTFTAGTRNVRIVRLSDQHVLAEASISANPPSVSNVHLVGAPNPVVGTVTLAWSASDPDGDALKFDIYYSHDAGVSFQPIIMHTSSTSIPIDTSTLGGGTGVFRVIASDGANIGSSNSAPFTMASKSPTPTITLPSSNVHTHYGQVVNFSGLAWDAQDGVLSGSGLVWSSITGTLHVGPMFTQSLLPPGINVITLTATNSKGLSASTSVIVNVDDNIDPDGPTMDVAPGTITWHINSGVTTPQTQTLTVSNFGTGYLGIINWQASSNAPAWLTLSKTSGVDGDATIATGNPSGMNNGEARTGQLTFTTNSNGYTQTIQVPVMLIKGDLFQSPYLGPMPPFTLYLPEIIK